MTMVWVSWAALARDLLDGVPYPTYGGGWRGVFGRDLLDGVPYPTYGGVAGVFGRDLLDDVP